MLKFLLPFFFSVPVLGQQLIPAKFPGDTLVNHIAYTISYSTEHKQAHWNYYLIVARRQYGKVKRKSSFIANPQLAASQSCSDSDYQGCGFDRGHLAPAEDMSFSRVAMNESFFLSNVSPQVAGFNRGIWKRLETQVRRWKTKSDTIHVITGGCIHNGLPKIKGSISIPDSFYKIAIAKDKKGNLNAIAFKIPNKPSKRALTSYLVTIDELEALTKIDFCYHLPDASEATLESSKANLSFWSIR